MPAISDNINETGYTMSGNKWVTKTIYFETKRTGYIKYKIGITLVTAEIYTKRKSILKKLDKPDLNDDEVITAVYGIETVQYVKQDADFLRQTGYPQLLFYEWNYRYPRTPGVSGK